MAKIANPGFTSYNLRGGGNISKSKETTKLNTEQTNLSDYLIEMYAGRTKYKPVHHSFRRSVHIEPRVGENQLPVRTSVAAARNQHQQHAARTRNRVAVREEDESQSNAVVSHYGKWRIPHRGYDVVVDKMNEIAKKHKADQEIALSGQTNPLGSHENKVKHARRMFPGANITSEQHPNFLAHAADLNKRGYNALHVVVGSDRAEGFKDTLERYNGKPDKKGNVLYNFPGGIHVHTAGEERVEGSEGTAGSSSTQQEKHAREGNFKAFSDNSPRGAKEKDVKALYNDVRKGLLKESFVGFLKQASNIKV
jgi:hypothetical protein